MLWLLLISGCPSFTLCIRPEMACRDTLSAFHADDWPLPPSLPSKEAQGCEPSQPGNPESNGTEELMVMTPLNKTNEGEKGVTTRHEYTENPTIPQRALTYEKPDRSDGKHSFSFEKQGIIRQSIAIPKGSPVIVQNPVLDTKPGAIEPATADVQSSKSSTTRPVSHSIISPIKKSGQTATKHTVHFAKVPSARQTYQAYQPIGSSSTSSSQMASSPSGVDAQVQQRSTGRSVSQFVSFIRQREDIVGRRLNPKLARLQNLNHGQRFSGSRNYGTEVLSLYFPELKMTEATTSERGEGA